MELSKRSKSDYLGIKNFFNQITQSLTAKSAMNAKYSQRIFESPSRILCLTPRPLRLNIMSYHNELLSINIVIFKFLNSSHYLNLSLRPSSFLPRTYLLIYFSKDLFACFLI